MDPDALMRLIAAQQQQIAELAAAVREQSTAIAAAANKPERGAGITVVELWREYAETICLKSWYGSVKSLMKAPLAHFGAMDVLSLRRSDWEHYRDVVRPKQEKTTHLYSSKHAAATLNQELSRLRACFNWAVSDDRLARNPLAAVKRLKGRSRETIVADDDVETLVRQCGPLLRAMILIAVDSGMRATEVRLLQWTEIDFDRGLINLLPERTKGKKARRPRVTERALDAIRMLPRHLTSPYVFANPTSGKPYSENWVWRHWRQVTADVGLQAAPGDTRVHLHDLKHSAVSKMHRIGVPLFTGMRNAGHESAAMAWRYTQVTEEDLDDLKDKMDRAILAGPRRGPRRNNDGASESKTPEKKIVTSTDGGA